MEKRFLIRWNEQVVRELVIMANSEEEIIPKTVSENLIE